MSGHSKWSKIKHQKAVEDVKKGQVFSRIAAEITAAAKSNPDPGANPSLKAAIDKARAANMPQDKITRAIERVTSDKEASGEPFVLEVLTRRGESIIIKGQTDNKNRTLSELRQTISQHRGKVVSPGAVSWNFDGDKAKITRQASNELAPFLAALKEHPEVMQLLTDTTS